MGHLKRARSTEAKEARRVAILRVARDLFDEHPFDAISMAEVATKSRLAKGTVFLYFSTKEALFFELLDALLGEWLGMVHELVAQDDKPWPSARLARVLTETLADRPALERLLPMSATVLEPNVPAPRLAEFRHKLLRRYFSTGALIEQRLGLAHAGDGVTLLTFANAMIVGLCTGNDTDLRTALTVLFNGFHRKGGG